MKSLYKPMILLLCLSLSTSGCATKSKTRTLITVAAGAVCFAIGAATAKDDEEPVFYGAAGASPCLLGGHLLGETYFSSEKDLEKVKRENERLNSLRQFQVTDEGVGSFVGKDGKPGKILYSVKEGVRWRQVDENTRVKEVMEVKRVPLKKSQNKKSEPKKK